MIAGVWWHRAILEARKPLSLVPGWFSSDLACIGVREEGGSNSVAGRYGFVFSPSSYGGVASQLAEIYGESWLDWPVEPQQRVAWMLYQRYGWSPWSTAAPCGL